MDPPNIVLILADQHRTDALGFLGRTPCRTPNLDRLAAGGVSFDRCVSTSPICTPARCSIFTSLYPHQARGVLEQEQREGVQAVHPAGSSSDMMWNSTSLREPPLLTDRLRECGYHVASAGKWHLGDDVLGRWFDRYAGNSTPEYSRQCLERGLPDGWAFNDMSVRSERTPHMSIPRPVVEPMDAADLNDAWIADHAIRMVETRPKDQPLFLTCSFNGPHPPLKVPEPYFSMYDPRDIPEPDNFRPSPDEPEANKSSFYRLLWQDHGTDWEAWKKSVAVYWGFVTLIDAEIGRLIQCLEREGMLDNTLILYASDHGEMLGQHGLWHKSHSYEEALRVPMIAGAPWIRQGAHSRAPVSLLDVAPTILGAAGIDAPREYEGVDLSGAMIAGDGQLDGRLLFSEIRPIGPWHGIAEWRMVAGDRYKYTWCRGDRDELFDLQQDPQEMTNLIDRDDAQPQLEQLRAALREWMEATDEPLLVEFAKECDNVR